MSGLVDDFKGDNERLIACIEALLDLDAAKALVPHGIGGHARGLLSAAGARLAAKDAEIAELRARPTMELLSELLRGLEMPSLAAAAASSQLYAIGVAIADQAKRCAAAERERDEAREEAASYKACVGRLYGALRSVGQSLAWHSFGELRSYDHFGSTEGPPLALSVADNLAKSELAATPEHLRH